MIPGHSTAGRLMLPVELPFELPTRVYGAMLAVWQLRPALQIRFPLHAGHIESFVAFLAWCAVEGRSKYRILRELPEWDAELNRPATLPGLDGDRWDGLLTVGGFFCGVSRYRYALGPMLRRPHSREEGVRHYWLRGYRQMSLPPPAWLLLRLRERVGSPERLAATLFGGKREVRGAPIGRQAFIEDLEVEYRKAAQAGDIAPHEAPAAPASALRGRPGAHLPIPASVAYGLVWMTERARKFPSEHEKEKVSALIPQRAKPAPLRSTPFPFGVNLIGYARGELGLGEDVRLVAAALAANGIPFCIVNVELHPTVSQQDRSVEQWISPEPRYAINLFCTTGMEHARFIVERGQSMILGRYNIGLWPWELPRWPACFEFAFDAVDEIWGISQYTAAAYAAFPGPVQAMTLPVVAEPVAELGRKHFGLPDKTFLFVFSFDFNSTLTRKNPEGVVEAFHRAFPKGSTEPVALVVKASHVKRGSAAWYRIRLAARFDSRIRLIDTTLRKPEVMALYRACDCYVSLHRSEGFGRALAESLLLGKELIATAYSGNLDFCNADRVGLVDYREVVLKHGDYPHGDGQSWAEPDIDHAARLMREAIARPRSGAPGPDLSPESIGMRYAARLRSIGSELGA